MFTLAIFYLTTSNLPWFMDLMFQVPMQYCSLQHWTLLSLPDTSTTKHHFCFCPASSFFLELLVIVLCSSVVAYWTLSALGELYSGVISLFLYTIHGVLKARILKWFAIPFSSGLHFVRTLHYDLSILGGPAQHVIYFHWVMQVPSPWQHCDLWRVDWGGFTNSWWKKRSEKQGRKGKINPTECRVPENSKER